jgi:hypothetical protein
MSDLIGRHRSMLIEVRLMLRSEQENYYAKTELSTFQPRQEQMLQLQKESSMS